MMNFKTIKARLVFSLGIIGFFLFTGFGVYLFLATDKVIQEQMSIELDNISEGVFDMASTSFEINQKTVMNNLRVASHFIHGRVSLLTDTFLSMDVENQITHEKKKVQIPVMTLGGEPLAGNMEMVDVLTDLYGGTSTIFQIIPEGLLRISTSVKKLDGTRAVGTYIPKDSEVYKTVMQGQTFYGRAFVVSDWYISAYEPIMDESQNLIGVLYVGVKQSDLEILREKVLSYRIGTTGVPFIIDSAGNVIIHSSAEGKNILDLKDIDGNFYVKEMCDTKNGWMTYTTADERKAGNEFATKSQRYKYFEPMDWIIVSGTYSDEMLPFLRNMRILMIGILVLVLVILEFSVFIIARNLSRPIGLLTKGAEKLALGDISLKNMNRTKFDKIKLRKDELGAISKAFNKIIEYQQEKVEATQEIARGDLCIQVTVSSEEDSLGIALKDMVGSLNDLLQLVDGAVGQVSVGSAQIAQGSQELSRGATEQASSLEEISSSLVEIDGQSKRNAESAEEANALSKKAMSNAEEGKARMEDLTGAMELINASADGIRRIVKVIDDIAFQINLLALNANVEAARAGKYGKGFAVVAEEVRNLANKSAEAVKETAVMVEDTTMNIASGDEAVMAVAEKLRQIVTDSAKISDFLQEIAQANREQAKGIEQITIGLQQVEEVTQSNTAGAEESASSAEELSSQSQELKEIISRFSLVNSESGYLEGPG